MTDISSATLTPYWYTPKTDNDDGVKFKLKPLTQPQLMELSDSHDDKGIPTNGTFYLAGCMAIEGGREIDGLTVDGKPASWMIHKDLVPNVWVLECGVDVYVKSVGSEEIEKNS